MEALGRESAARRSRSAAFTGVTARAGAQLRRWPLAAGSARSTSIRIEPARVIGEASPWRAALLPRGPTGIARSRSAASSAPIGKAITGACNLAFLFIVASGIYLWWPRNWTRRQLRSVDAVQAEVCGGKARDFNWHNVIGFWSAIPLFAVVLGATVGFLHP